MPKSGAGWVGVCCGIPKAVDVGGFCGFENNEKLDWLAVEVLALAVLPKGVPILNGEFVEVLGLLNVLPNRLFVFAGGSKLDFG